jgi:hypothetical protein
MQNQAKFFLFVGTRNVGQRIVAKKSGDMAATVAVEGIAALASIFVEPHVLLTAGSPFIEGNAPMLSATILTFANLSIASFVTACNFCLSRVSLRPIIRVVMLSRRASRRICLPAVSKASHFGIESVESPNYVRKIDRFT